MANVKEISIESKYSDGAPLFEASPESNSKKLSFIPLKTSFRKNGLPYKLMQRNDVVALYGVGGTYTDKILHYEVCRIAMQKENDRFGKHFEASEVIPGNEEFGKEGSRAIVGRKEAIDYFNELTTILKTHDEGQINSCP